METRQKITIDLTYLHSVTEGNKEFEKMLLQGAVNDIQEKIDNLEKAWKEQDTANIRSNAHSLKSLSAIAGLTQIENWSKTIDQLFSDGHFHSTITEPFTGIFAGWLTAKPKLKQVLAAY